MQMKIPREMLLYVINVVDRIPEIIRASGNSNSHLPGRPTVHLSITV